MHKEIVSSFRVLFLCLWLLSCINVFGKEFANWDSHNVNDGLADNYVQCLLEDNKGFLWVGTWSGLSRFDGDVYKTYTKGTSSKNTIPGSWIYCIIQDRNGKIWVGTDEGVACYNEGLDVFQRVLDVPAHAIIALQEDRFGHVFAAAGNAIFKIDARSEKILETKNVSAELFVKGEEISALACDKNGALWIAFPSRILLWTTGAVNLTPVNIAASGVVPQHIRCMQFDGDGSLWIGTSNSGLFHYLPASPLQSRRFVFSVNNSKSISDNRVESIYMDEVDNLWVVAPNGTINKFNRIENNFERFVIAQETKGPKEIIASSCFLIDRFENTWIGSHGNGLLSVNKHKQNFINVGSASALSNGNKISSFLCLPNGNVLVGSDGAGLFLFRPNGGGFESVDLGAQFQNAKILAIEQSTTLIWLAFWEQGIASIDPLTFKVVQHFSENHLGGESLGNMDIKGLCVSDSLLWISSNGDGVFTYNLTTQKFVNRNSKQRLFDFAKPRWCNSIFVDSQQRLWISTAKGLFMSKGKMFKHFTKDIQNEKSIASNQISAVYEDAKKNIWIIGNEGLDLFKERDHSFVHCSSLYKLPKNMKGIVEDQKGHLWLSSNEGIVCFDYSAKSLLHFTFKDGLPSNTFYQNSASITPQGYLLFGSLNGFTFFNPDSIRLSKVAPEVLFSDFQLNYISQVPAADGQRHIQSLDTMEVDYSNSAMTFKFVAVDLCNSKNISYSYYLENYNNNWVDLGKQNFVSFTNLSPGEYVLRVRARNANGVYSKHSAKLRLIVLPPWYKSAVAYVVYVLLAISFLYFIYYFLTFALRTQNKLTLQKLEHQKKLEIYNAKIDFFTSISHDIRTPLTLILSPLDLLRDKIKSNEEAIEMLDTVDANAHNLLDLTNELLEFKTLESGERKIKLQHTALQEIFEKVMLRFNNEALIKNIQLSSSFKDCAATLDPHLVDKALNNLLVNAFKFTPENGSVIVSLWSTEEQVLFSVCNSGSHIADDLQRKIFDPFFTSKNDKGFGLGLAIVKEIAALHKARVSVKNTKDGVEFTMIFSKKKQ